MGNTRRVRKMFIAGMISLCLLTVCAGCGKTIGQGSSENTAGSSYTEAGEPGGAGQQEPGEPGGIGQQEPGEPGGAGQQGAGGTNPQDSESLMPEESGAAEDQKPVELPKQELHVDVSLASDRKEARVYEAFLNGESRARVRAGCETENFYCDPVKGQEKFSFQEILDNVWLSIKEDHNVDGMGNVEYALIDCGSDGIPELAVRLHGLSIYDRQDDSDLLLIFVAADGQAELIYAVETWARSYMDVYSDGFVSGGGSDGAFTHYVKCGFIGADGDYRSIYDMHVETGRGLWEMSDIEWDSDEEVPMEFYECQLGEDKCYAYYIVEDTPKDQKEKIQAYITQNAREMEVGFISWEELDAMIDARIDSLGARKMIQAQDRWERYSIRWQTLEGCDDYLY